MSDGLEQFHATFFEESFEGLDIMESSLMELDLGTPDPETINAIFRAAHSIKGGSGAFNFTEIASFTHVLETLLDDVRCGGTSVRQDLIDLLLSSVDCVRSLIEAQRDGSAPDAEAIAATLDALQAALGGGAEPDLEPPTAGAGAQVAQGEASGWRIEIVPAPDLLKTGNEPVRILRELDGLGPLGVEADLTRLPPLAELEPEQCYLSWKLELGSAIPREKLDDIFDWIADDCDISVEAWVDATRVAGEAGNQRIGDLAVAAGIITPAQRDEVLELARNDTLGRRFGVLAASLGVMSLPQLEELLEKQKSSAPKAPPQSAGQPAPPAAVSPAAVPASAKTGPGGEGAAGVAGLAAAKPTPAAAPAAAPARPAAPRESASIRVSTDKIDALVNLVGELVITQSMLGEVGRDFDVSRLESLFAGLGQLERNTRELQEAVMQIRMLPVSVVFNRFPRLVRDTSRNLGKKIELVISGEGTEIDKTVLEKISDPIVHLLRNSLDHGIEAPDARVEVGKPESGTVHLSASHQSGSIVIEIRDDGAGINTEKLLAKARERGDIDPSETPSESEIIEMIFRPGVSSADEVTDVSGRGVGMDVVRRNIKDLNGSIEVESELGTGSTFTIRLPLTLAILDGQLLRIGDEIFVLPLISIIETVQANPRCLNVVAGEVETYRMRDEYLPVIRSHDVLLGESANESLDGHLLVIVEAEGRKAALVVDELLTQQQVVIKSLETNFSRVSGVSGATILGTGHVALILDVPGLLRMAHRAPASPRSAT